MRRPLVIGLGQALRGDDGLGPAVITALRKQGFDRADLVQVDSDLLDLLDLWQGRETIIVDAVRSGREPGAIIEFDALNERLPAARTASSHAIDLATAIELGRALDQLPRSLWLIGVEAEHVTFGTPFSEHVLHVIASAATRVRVRLTATSAFHPRD
jgi:hydrogenase maturation protease